MNTIYRTYQKAYNENSSKIVVTLTAWQFLRYAQDNIIEVDKYIYSLTELEKLLGTWQFVINQCK